MKAAVCLGAWVSGCKILIIVQPFLPKVISDVKDMKIHKCLKTWLCAYLPLKHVNLENVTSPSQSGQSYDPNYWKSWRARKAWTVNAIKLILAYPTGISMNPIRARKCCLSCMMSGCCFDVMKSVLTSQHQVLTLFSGNRYDIYVAGRSQTKHFLTKNVDILA